MENDTRYFQWIVGDRKGEVMVFDKIESEGSDVFIVFKDESRINENFVALLNQKDLTGKLMAEIDSPTNVWTFKDEWVGRQEEKWQWRDETNPIEKVCVQPFVEGRKVIKLIPPKPTPPNHSVFGRINNMSQTEVPSFIRAGVEYADVKPKIDTNDPIYILISTSKKIDSEISMNISISLPPKSLYDIAKESFDEGGTKFVEYIIENITVNEIKDALKISITQMYEKSDDTYLK
jgi:hypothetical protein